MKTLKLIWKNKDLRNKLLIVIAILFGIRILSGIPTPGVNRNYFKLLLAQNSTLNFFNAISGNGLSNLSIMALSITPYITASIIIQLLGVIFPQVKELQQCKTKADKRKYEWILVFSGAGLACLESLTMAIGFGRKGLLTKYKWYYVLLITVIWTIMATLTSIIGKIISVKLVGNGISLILVSNILSSYPSDSANIYEVLMKGKKTYIAGLHLFFLLILITALFIFTVWLQDTEKKIPVTYSGKLQGKSTFKGVSTTDIDFSYPARSINLKQKCKITLGTRLSFSDIGECAFRLQNCIFTNGGTILLPQEASRKKSNKLSPEGIVKDYNSQCYMKFDKIMEQLKSYGTIPVTDMQQSVWNILEKLKFSSAFGFSNTRDLQKNYLSTFEKEGDALDVVIKILKIPGVLQRNYPGTTHDRVNECIGKIFNLKMEKLIV